VTRKKEETGLVPLGETPDLGNFSNIEDTSMGDFESGETMAARRRRILREAGVRGTKKKYGSAEERKAASKARAKERKERDAAILEKFGLAPRSRGPKMTKEEKKAKSKARRQQKSQFLREAARSQPDFAKKFGIDITRFKL